MPIQGPQWTEFLTCPICLWGFNRERGPVSLSCGHTICKACLQELHRKRCPFDQSVIGLDLDQLPLNWALLQLSVIGAGPWTSLPTGWALLQLVTGSLTCFSPGGGSGGGAGGPSVLSRSMQRKLVTIVTCQLLEPEGRSRVLRACRSLGERTVTELILHHQNPAQLSANLWAAVRARGCQFLGPAMQEEVLRLVLLALEEGYALSRKVLVMFVVQRLEPHFPQASKTSIGHVVQLLYRASCFKVTKREGDSSLMQLKEEFRTYEALRREHDAQIVQIALEAGLRIAPDQWSSLLYGDVAHKSHMQSIMDKLQSPSSFNQSIQELIISLQKTGDPAGLSQTRLRLQTLAAVDPAPDSLDTDWEQVVTALEAAVEVVRVLISFVHNHGGRRVHVDTTHAHNAKYKTNLCRDLKQRGTCPRGPACTFAHSEEELERYRAKSRRPKKAADRAESPPPPPPSLPPHGAGLPLRPQKVAPAYRLPADGRLRTGAAGASTATEKNACVMGLVPPPAVPVPVVHAVARLPYQLEYFTPVCSPGPAGVLHQQLVPAVQAAAPPPPQPPPPPPPPPMAGPLYGGRHGMPLQSPPRPGQAITSLSSSGLHSAGGSIASTAASAAGVAVNVNSSSIASKSLTALRQRKQEILHQLENINGGADGEEADSPPTPPPPLPPPPEAYPVPAAAAVATGPSAAAEGVAPKHYSIWTSSDNFFYALKSSLAGYQNTKSRGTDTGPVYSNVRVSSNEDEYIPFSSSSEGASFGPISRTERSGTTPSRPVQVSALSGETLPTETASQPRPMPGHVIPQNFMQICDPYLYSGGVQYQLVQADGCGMHYNTIGHGVLDPPGLQMLRLKPCGDRPSDPLPMARNQEGSRLAAENRRFQNELDSLERKFQTGVKVLSPTRPEETEAEADESRSLASQEAHLQKDLIRELWFIEHGIEEKQKENKLNVRTSYAVSAAVAASPAPVAFQQFSNQQSSPTQPYSGQGRHFEPALPGPGQQFVPVVPESEQQLRSSVLKSGQQFGSFVLESERQFVSSVLESAGHVKPVLQEYWQQLVTSIFESGQQL
ncbi:LOW QUALITY PROTEIN: roquin-1-like [Pollicipes pollicipes]|uniref:LOW QUALITY PROTEIN: roquin-1-like n=1 Tax=Pollicipes pollicipes TaxID=41117 RepID=UPI001884FCDC|nr:LOW QUALITY PROTEIN: roquin-1-like [Pollicipes pollicipes]